MSTDEHFCNDKRLILPILYFHSQTLILILPIYTFILKPSYSYFQSIRSFSNPHTHTSDLILSFSSPHSHVPVPILRVGSSQYECFCSIEPVINTSQVQCSVAIIIFIFKNVLPSLFSVTQQFIYYANYG